MSTAPAGFTPAPLQLADEGLHLAQAGDVVTDDGDGGADRPADHHRVGDGQHGRRVEDAQIEAAVELGHELCKARAHQQLRGVGRKLARREESQPLHRPRPQQLIELRLARQIFGKAGRALRHREIAPQMAPPQVGIDQADALAGLCRHHREIDGGEGLCRRQAPRR